MITIVVEESQKLVENQEEKSELRVVNLKQENLDLTVINVALAEDYIYVKEQNMTLMA